jgi:hypothetical protein
VPQHKSPGTARLAFLFVYHCVTGSTPARRADKSAENGLCTTATI